MDTVEVGGLQLGYQRAGSGPGLVLLHGGYCDSRVWRWQLDALSDEFTVVAWDAPGCGRSDDPPPGFGANDFADCLAGFIAAVGLTRPHVLGLSFGSVLALELYRRHPDLPASLVLAAAYAGWAGSLPAEEVERRISQARRELTLTPEQFLPAWLPTLLTQRAPRSLVVEITAIMAQFHPAGMATMLDGFARVDYRPVLPTISVPTLLLYGDEDRRSPLTVAQGMHEAIPGSTLVVLPEVGHLSNAEAPDAFNTEVRRFVAGIASP